VLRLPNDGVSVEVSGGVKPKIKLLLSVTFTLSEDVCVKNIRVTTCVSQELKINLIMGWPLG
jgi:hypothetical protein